ncbi:MAG: hypothetical protein R3192_17485, partial [Woeseiaceae bacterium]|nr:hypothetical protein [Woeseiaceae bacterium]
MRVPICLLILIVTAACSRSEAPLPASTVPAERFDNRPGEIAANLVDRAIEAHGGNRLTGMPSLVTEWLLDDSLIFQSRRPQPPWDRASRWEAYAIDFVGERYADARYDGSSGYEWLTGTVSDRSGTFRIDYRNRT